MGPGTQLVFVTIHINTYQSTGWRSSTPHGGDHHVYNRADCRSSREGAGNGAFSNPESEDPISDSYWVNRGFAHLNSVNKASRDLSNSRFCPFGSLAPAELGPGVDQAHQASDQGWASSQREFTS
jgi:hypothetical protein